MSGRFELRQDEETGRRYWWGGEDGWKDPTEVGADGVLTVSAEHFKVGSILLFTEPAECDELDMQRLNAAVDSFVVAMKAKLAKKHGEGFTGWDDPANEQVLGWMLEQHVQRGRGQEVDVANLAMMLWWQSQHDITE